MAMSTPAKPKTGRALEFEQAIADVICVRLAEGESLRAICRDPELPAMSTVMKWLNVVPTFAEQYARARELQADAIFDEALDIADTAGLTNERIAKARLQIDTRKWMAGKMRPKKYGDKHIVGADPENPLPTPVANIDVTSLAKALRIAKAAPAAEDDGKDVL